MKNIYFAILTIFALAACAVQPATHADLPDTVHTTAPADWSVDVPKSDADPAAWWNQFNDPAMHELVASVLNSNLDLQAAVERVKQAQALTTQRRAALRSDHRTRDGASRPQAMQCAGQIGVQRDRTAATFLCRRVIQLDAARQPTRGVEQHRPGHGAQSDERDLHPAGILRLLAFLLRRQRRCRAGTRG